jgi:hypothetical protein
MANGAKSCFVVMGFGEKTDFQSNPPRVLNLNKTYEYIIEPAVTEAGLECVRADQIIHSTVIDKPMYERLLDADLVVADLSTSNANAIYELGVRHALKPTTTIVMAENNFSFPFDLNHLSILKYEHLGKEIGYGEVLRVKKALKDKIVDLVVRKEVDSPVYLFLPTLTRAEVAAKAMAAAPAPAPSSAPTDPKSFAELINSFLQARDTSDWLMAIAFLNRLRTMQPEDSYILQQLALATYKSAAPDKLTALQAARKILEQLSPATSADPETVGLWGAVHKRLWETGGDRADLDAAVGAYERGFVIKKDYYNGINYAFMLDVRASGSNGDEALADRVLARRIRSRVLEICENKLTTGGIPKGGIQPAIGAPDDAFWIGATKVEALFGLGRREEAESLKAAIIAEERDRLRALGTNTEKEIGWRVQTMNDQLEALAKLLADRPG